MGRWKQTIFLLISLMFVISLAACGGSNTGNENAERQDAGSTNDDNTPESSSNAEDPKAEDVVDEEEVKIDFDGKELRITMWWDATPTEGSADGDAAVERHKEIEEKYNVNIKYFASDYHEIPNLLSASVMGGEPFAEIVLVPENYITGIVNGGFATPISDQVDLNKYRIPDYILDAGQMGTEKVYGFLANFAINESAGLYYNKRIFEEAGIPTPTELQIEGRWNWDTFLQAAQATTVDKNGNGEVDQYGISTGALYLANFLVHSNNAFMYDEAQKKATFDSPNSLQALDFLNALYNEHGVVKPNEGNDWEDPNRYFREGNVAMYAPGGVWEINARMEGNMEDPFGFVFFPQGPTAVDYVVPKTGMHLLVIPKGVDAESVFHIWHELQAWDDMKMNELEWIENRAPDESSFDTMTQMPSKWVMGRYHGLGVEEVLGPMITSIVEGEATPSTAVSQYISQAQAKIDEALDN